MIDLFVCLFDDNFISRRIGGIFHDYLAVGIFLYDFFRVLAFLDGIIVDLDVYLMEYCGDYY